MKPDDECQHLIVTRWIESKTGKPVDLWSCEDCRRRFEPLQAPRNDFRNGMLDKEITKKLTHKEAK